MDLRVVTALGAPAAALAFGASTCLAHMTLADRFLRTIDAIRPLHPLLDTWTWGDSQEVWETEGEGGTYPFAEIRPDIVRAIERNACNGGEGVPDPFYGYLMMVQSDQPPEGRGIGLAISASKGVNGGSPVSAFCNNYAKLDIKLDPDPTLVTFAPWRSLMLILCETWEATWAETSPQGIQSEWRGIPVRCAWMNYVSPRFAPLITPPASAIVDPTAASSSPRPTRRSRWRTQPISPSRARSKPRCSR